MSYYYTRVFFFFFRAVTLTVALCSWILILYYNNIAYMATCLIQSPANQTTLKLDCCGNVRSHLADNGRGHLLSLFYPLSSRLRWEELVEFVV